MISSPYGTARDLAPRILALRLLHSPCFPQRVRDGPVEGKPQHPCTPAPPTRGCRPATMSPTAAVGSDRRVSLGVVSGDVHPRFTLVDLVLSGPGERGEHGERIPPPWIGVGWVLGGWGSCSPPSPPSPHPLQHPCMEHQHPCTPAAPVHAGPAHRPAAPSDRV